MKQHYPLQPDQSRATLIEAIGNRMPATATFQADEGWAICKTRFSNADVQSSMLSLELTPHAAEPDCQPETGQEVGISFRRGSRKCVFTSTFVEKVAQPGPGGRTLILWRLSWPEAIQELQRRLYHRTPVPEGKTIPVDLWLTQAATDAAVVPLSLRGKMLDLSAGGLSVELPGETRLRWRENDQLACRFAVGPDRRPIEVTARLTSHQRLNSGPVRVGLQFLGLDTGDRGRQTLQEINQMTSRLRRCCPNPC